MQRDIGCVQPAVGEKVNTWRTEVELVEQIVEVILRKRRFVELMVAWWQEDFRLQGNTYFVRRLWRWHEWRKRSGRRERTLVGRTRPTRWCHIIAGPAEVAVGRRGVRGLRREPLVHRPSRDRFVGGCSRALVRRQRFPLCQPVGLGIHRRRRCERRRGREGTIPRDARCRR